MTQLQILPVAKYAFWISFLSGNICLFGYLFSGSFEFATAGFLLLFVATIVNLIILLGFATYAITGKKEIKECRDSALLLIVNIPFAVLYAWIGLQII